MVNLARMVSAVCALPFVTAAFSVSQKKNLDSKMKSPSMKSPSSSPPPPSTAPSSTPILRERSGAIGKGTIFSSSLIPSSSAAATSEPISLSLSPPLSPSPSSLLPSHKNTKIRANSKSNLAPGSPAPPPPLTSSLSSKKLFEKETKVVDGIKFTTATENTKFSFKKTTVTALQDEISEDTNSQLDFEKIEEINEGKARNFEFTNNKSLMRVIRAIIFFQMIAMICDNPAVQFPPLFEVLCHTPLFYVIRFYSYPFVDAIYIIERGWKQCLKFFIHIYHIFPKSLPSFHFHPPSQANSPPHRMLDVVSLAESIQYKIDFTSPRDWHTITLYSHYILGCAFFVLAILLTLKTWQIRDYTNRDHVKAFIFDYIADRWYLRGGLKIIGIMICACFVVVGILAILYGISQQEDYNAPNPVVIGSIGCVCLAAIVGIFIIALFIVRAAEAVFVQYVSQNVNYTSAIILKRVLKSKIELAIAIVILIFFPVMYTLFRSLMIITDWNDNHVLPHRLKFNYNTPCYFDAFPPFTKDLGKDDCPNYDSISSSVKIRNQGYYDDANILPCDSILGISFYTLSFVLLPLYIVLFVWFITRIIRTATTQATTSRWYDAVESVVQKYLLEKSNYEKDFTWIERSVHSFFLELKQQEKFIEDVLYWLLVSIVSLGIHSIQYCVILPIYILITPFVFYGKRIALLLFNYDIERSTRHVKFITGEQIIDGIVNSIVSVVKTCRSYLVKQMKITLRNIGRSAFVGSLRLACFRIRDCLLCQDQISEKGRRARQDDVVSTTSKIPRSGLRITTGEWRNDLKIKYREKQLKLALYKINNELENVLLEIVSDHTLTIDMLDTVVDTAGYVILICQYRWTRLWFTRLLPIELVVYAALAAVTNYYLNWHDRAYVLLGFNCVAIFLTYCIQPYWNVVDRWIDWIGRIMVIFIAYGLIISDQTTATSEVNSYLETGDRRGFSKLMFTLRQAIQMLKSGDEASYFLLDLAMVAFFYLFILNIMENIGIFRYLARKFRQMQYAMHDYVVDFLIAKTGQRALGVENMHIGLPLIQQWDDIIKDQRRYGVIPYPDVRPPSLLSVREKLIEVKWAAFFNLTISNMRTSLGLTILHIVMCSADPEITRWLIHSYPQLLSQEDFQRDTPISIALKECAYYLLLYAHLNDGMMDDGTTFSDEDFYDSFPDVLQMRDEVKYHGEIIPDAIVTYELTATERDHLQEHGFLIEQDPSKRSESALTIGLNVNVGTTLLGGPSLFAQGLAKKREMKLNQANLNITALPPPPPDIGRKFSTQSVGFSSKIHVKRYPEDDFYDDFEGGQASGWILLNLKVSENMIDNECYGSDSDFDSDEEDLRYGIKESFPQHSMDDVKYVPENHTLLSNLINSDQKKSYDHTTGFELILRKKEVRHMTKRDSVTFKSLISSNPFGLRDKEKNRKDPNEQKNIFSHKDQEILWRLCKYADIFLSDQVFVHCFEMGWNISTYKDLNKMSSKLQGLASQHLAVCFNLNPPADFVRFSDWSTGIVENIREEYGAYDAALGEERLLNGKLGDALNGVSKGLEAFTSLLLSRKKGALSEDVFNDRIVQYLAECYAGSRDEADLSDADLGISARVAWRAISRAYRKKTCTFIIPGIFTPPKPIILMKLYLQRNELDCGDAVIIADILINQQTLIYLDVSHNRIGSRGMNRICLGLKAHRSIRTVRVDYNRIGPYSGKSIGAMIKIQQTLHVLSLSHNRMGDIVRFPATTMKETLSSAGKYIFFGLKNNKSLMSLDVSYNDLGPSIASIIPLAVSRHPRLYSLNIAGNNIGSTMAVPMVYALSNIGQVKKSRHNGSEGAESRRDKSQDERMTQDGKSDNGKKKYKSVLADLNLADNQLGEELGVPLGQLIKNSSTLTSLDISRNSLGVNGGKSFSHALSTAFGYTARKLEREIQETEKNNLKLKKAKQLEDYKQSRKLAGYSALDDGMSDFGDFDEDPSTVVTNTFPPHWKQQIILTYLNVSRNNLGPVNVVAMMEALSMPNCTLTMLDISENPLGVSFEKAGKAFDAGNAIRSGVMKCPCLARLNLNRLAFEPPQILPILGGISNNISLMEIQINDMPFDEPCCLQLSNAIAGCSTLEKIVLRNIRMGPKGGGLVCINVERVVGQLKYLDLTGSKLGFSALEPVFRSIANHACQLTTLYLADNEMDHEGGMSLCGALRHNQTITDLDISKNLLTTSVAIDLADCCKQYTINGKIVTPLRLEKLKINDNPDIGPKGTRQLILCLASEWTTHLEMRNCGASESFANEFAKALKNVAVAWKYIDIRQNQIRKVGLNQIFWSLRVNRKIRILKLGSNQAGLGLGTDTDTMGSHGIGFVRAFQENLIIRHLDLSYLGLSTAAAINLFTALKYNFSIRVLNLRGNCFEDGCNTAIEQFLTTNDVITDLDLGENKFQGTFPFAIAEGLFENRSLQTLILDKTNFAIASGSTLDIFTESLLLNHTLRRLNLDGNRMGTQWGLKMAEVITKTSTLTQFSLRNNRFDSRVGKALAQAYQHNNTLVELAVSSEEVGADAYEAIKTLFVEKRAPSHMNDVLFETLFEEHHDNDYGKLYV